MMDVEHSAEQVRALRNHLGRDANLPRILSLLSQGATFEATGRRLGLSPRTVRRKVRELCDEAGVDTTMELVVLAVRGDLL